jgi:hypothetical protein
VPDESFFQTVIMNSPYRNSVINNDRRHIEWRRGPEHPRIWRHEDLNELLSSNAFFARKFNADVDDRIIRALEERIIDGQFKIGDGK